LLSALSTFVATSAIYAGGIVTNTNQSAAFIRMPAQDATTGIQAVYHNPAGLTKLSDGFHIQVSNQSISQTKEIENTYAPLNSHIYTGDVAAPIFPTVYAAYKTGDYVFSLGINPIGGGGGAEYKTGLPSFEIPVASLPAMLSSQGIPTTAYSADIYFKGSSVYWGAQAGVSYKVNDAVSFFLGGRYVMVKNTYQGHINDIKINPIVPGLTTGDMMLAPAFFKNLSSYLHSTSLSAAGAATSLQPVIDANAGGMTLAQLQGASVLTIDQVTQLKGGLVKFGVPAANVDAMTAAQIQGAYSQYSAGYQQKADGATTNAATTSNQEADAEQTGTGFTPILGLDLTFLDNKLNVGIKYEFQTKMRVVNKTTKDIVSSPQFPDGEHIPSDMPALLSVGINYAATPEFRIALGGHYYWDQAAMYGKKLNGIYVDNKDLLTDNSWELAAGLEFDVSPKVTISGGYLMTASSPTLAYQSDLSYSLRTSSVAIGALGHINEALAVEIGFMYTSYNEDEKDSFVSPIGSTYKEIYRKKTLTAAIGVSYSFGKKSAE
jgi:opacity protein-like surface antigen